ncbi:MAG TPA: cbb3-type cytochrome oxidase assembly protein CcoS [Bacteroidales bacterium]|nr:cbb3-type cytochrome oxidase assembly protein CcoS [Aequorivita sp.]MCB0822101.1 cbb3-type cytochrome oxidase assembly protein CcoS [Bacteroidales bacterium]HPE57186.1 cbb3-type cytochrome oxidase assembly protein CcoS [Bacteroidales bacterium]HRX96399.1 cbb3-type cytochrome oxidase assembly protein CcoS [Bacteroidales bacterium]
MQVIFFLIAIGIVVAGGFLAAFIWSVKSGQYDDDYTPSVRMLFDNFTSDGEAGTSEEDKSKTSKQEAQSKQSNNNKT